MQKLPDLGVFFQDILPLLSDQEKDQLRDILASQSNDELNQFLEVKKLSSFLRDNSANTLLHLSAVYGTVDEMRSLLDQGLNVNAQNMEGYTPLMLAIKQNDLAKVDYLLNHNASVKLANKRGDTALHICSMTMGVDFRIAALLLKHGAVMLAKNRSDLTILHTGIENPGFTEFILNIAHEIDKYNKNTVVFDLICDEFNLTVDDIIAINNLDKESYVCQTA